MRTTVRLLAILMIASYAWGCGDPAAPPVEEDRTSEWLAQLTDDDPAVRRQAIESLGQAWPEGARAVPVLSEALDDEDAGVRAAAAASLEALALEGWPRLLAFLHDEEDPDRQAALKAVDTMRNLGPKVPPAKIAEMMLDYPRGGLVLMGLTVGMLMRDGTRNRANRDILGFVGACADPALHRGVGTDDPRWPEASAAVAAVAGIEALPADAGRPLPEGMRALRESDDANLAALGDSAFSLWTGVPWWGWDARDEPEQTVSFDDLLEALRRHKQSSTTKPFDMRVDELLYRLEALVPDLDAGRRARFAEVLIQPWVSDPGRRPSRRDVERLRSLGAQAAVAVPVLVRDLEAEEARWQQYLTEGSGEAAAGHYAALVAEDYGFRYTLAARIGLADTLGAIGPAAKDAVPLLERLAEEADPTLRYVAARSLRLIGD